MDVVAVHRILARAGVVLMLLLSVGIPTSWSQAPSPPRSASLDEAATELALVRPRLFAPCSLRRHYPEQVRGVPGRTRFSGILPPRRQGRVYQRGIAAAGRVPFHLAGVGCYLVDSAREISIQLGPRFSFAVL